MASPTKDSETSSTAAAETEPFVPAEVPFLVGTPTNPVPPGGQPEWVVTPDGTRLRTARWQADRQAGAGKGTVILLNGRTEFIEKYFETITELRERGFGVLAFDWRGQGASARAISDRKKGHVDHFDQYLTDLQTVLDTIALPECRPPFFILAHSAGSLIALRAAPALGNRIARMVLLAPLLSLSNLPVRQSTLQRVLGFLSFIGLGQISFGAWRTKTAALFERNRLTSDEARFSRNRGIIAEREDLLVGPPTISWTFAACRAMQQVRQRGFSQAISIPNLMVLAGRDEVVDVAVNEEYAQRMRTGGFVTIDGARHEILQERDAVRVQFWAAFDAFVPGGD